MLLRRGIFAGALFAGALFGAQQADEAISTDAAGSGHAVDYAAHLRELHAIRLEADDAEVMQAAVMALSYLIEERLI